MADGTSPSTAQPPPNGSPVSTLRQSIHRHGIMALPYKAHPIYNLRKASIIVAVIGIILCCPSFSSYPFHDGSMQASVFWLAVSVIFCAADVLFYAIKKVEKPDEDPKWPTRRWMIGDLVLGFILLIAFAVAISFPGYVYRTDVLVVYGVLPDLLCSLLHLWAFWKQLMARYKKKWLASLPKSPCHQCGHVEVPSDSNPSLAEGSCSARTSPASYHEPMFTPGSTESTMEEGLLIGSDYNGYGSIDDAEMPIEQPKEVVVGKRGKKTGNGQGKQAVKKTHVQMV